MMARKKPQLETESAVPQPSDLIDGPELETTAYRPEPEKFDVLSDEESRAFSAEAAAQVIEAAKNLELPVDTPPAPNSAQVHEVTKDLYAELLRKMELATKILSLQNLQSSQWRKTVRERLQEARNAMRFLDV